MAKLRNCRYKDNCIQCKYFSRCSDGGNVCHAPLSLTDGRIIYRILDKLNFFWIPKEGKND